MLPVKLKMQAFASYVNAAEIDFENLDSLFLIHGETGAGKTAVLDGMMYALYGESSGGERTEMRCALPSADNIPTEVEFVFRARGRLYKFTRSIIITPRSKKLEQRQDCFYLDSESGQYRSFFENPKQAFVRQKAEELTGLTAEQFRQVIILPQGRFERLLTSGSAEKEAILSTLFGAEKYTKLSDKLSEKAEAYRKDIAAENAAMKAMLAAENAESPEQLSEEADRLKVESDVLMPQLADSKKALAETREKLTAAELLAAKFNSLAEAENRLSVLDSNREKIEEMRRLLSINDTALKAKPEFTAAVSAAEAFKKRSEQLSAAEKNLAAAESELADILKKSESIKRKEAEHAKKTEEFAVLTRLAPVYEKIALAESTIKKLAAERLAAERSCGLTADSLEKTSAEIVRLSALREKITCEFSRRIPSLSARKTALENGAAAEKRLTKFTAALEGIKKKVSTLKIEAEQLKAEKNTAEKKYDKLYGEYLLNTASELSSKLKEGQPCPVCGSLSHPFPAEKSGNAVTSADVKNARTEFEKNAAALADKLSEAAAEEARIPAAEEYISGEKKIIAECGYSAAELKKVSEDLAEAERENGRLPEIDRQLEILAVQKTELEAKAKSDGEKLASLKTAETRAETECAALRGQLDSRFPDVISYNAGIKKLTEETSAFEREKQAVEQAVRLAERKKIGASAAMEQAKSELSAALNEKTAAEIAFSQKLAELNIPSEEEYKNSLLNGETAAKYTAETEKYALERHSVCEQLKSLKKELDGHTLPAVNEIRSAAAEAEKKLAELSGRSAVIAERLERLQKVTEEYSRRFAAGEKRREQCDKLTAFAKFMHGDKGISFTRYVLSIMLNLVTAEANRILADIHGGKFRLCIKSELAANSKQGLDLEVENLTADASVRYGVKNLSGGEKFLISLALSLGLSSVARSRSGGIEIEAMFIDEGFGSLDPASLREAVAILCGLTSRRNTIGIISHVEELKNVIPCGISVVKDKDGASHVLSAV